MTLETYKKLVLAIFLITTPFLYSCSKSGPSSASSPNFEPTEPLPTPPTKPIPPTDDFIQLKVLTQKASECSLHDTRNLLFAMAMFDDNKENYDREYKRMLDEHLLDEMAKRTNCSVNVWGHGERSSPKIKDFVRDNNDYVDYLPLKSKNNYLHRIIEVSAFSQIKVFNYIRKFIVDKIVAFETDYAKELHGVNDATFVASMTTSHRGRGRINFPLVGEGLVDILPDLYKWNRFLEGSSPFLGINLGLNSTAYIGHATALLLYKENNIIKAVFMDPLNWNYDQTENFKLVIEPLLRILKDKEYFNRTIIRARVFGMMYPKEPVEGDREWVYRVLTHGNGFITARQRLDQKFADKFYTKSVCEWLKNFKARADILPDEEKKKAIKGSGKILLELRCR